MEDSTVYPWASLPPAPEQHTQQSPDGAMGAFSATGTSQDHDPMLWSGLEGNNSSSEEAELPGDEPMNIDQYLLNKVNDLIQSKYPNLDLSPSPSLPAILEFSPNLDQTPDSWAFGSTMDTLQFPEIPPSETEYPQSHEKAVGMVGEGIVAGVNGVVPAMEDGLLMCADVPKGFDCIGVSAEESEVPGMCADATKTFPYIGAADGENEVSVMCGDAPKTSANIGASDKKQVPVMSANATPKTFPYVGASDGEATVPISARTKDQAYADTVKRETGAPDCLNNAKSGSQAYVTASGVLQEPEVGVPMNSAKTESQAYVTASGVLQEPEVGVPMNGAKTGSQAFNYVGDSALLETLGIPAAPLLAPTPHASPSSSMVALNILNDTLGLPNQAGTVDIDPKKSTVPPYSLSTVKMEAKDTAVPSKVVSATRYPPNSSGIVQIKTEKVTVPGQTTGTIKSLPQLGTIRIVPKESTVPVTTTRTIRYMLQAPGTPNIIPKVTTVPRKTVGTIQYLSGPIGTRSSVPEESVMIGKTDGTFNDCGTDVMSPNQNTALDETSAEQEMSGNAKKRRRRRKKQTEDDGQRQKVPKYKQGPLDDALEERKRRDAIRAKSGREKNKQKMLELQESLQKVEEERDGLARKVEVLSGEVAGRRAWETTLLALLQEKGIVVAPYGTPAKGTQPMSPAQPLTTSPGLPSR